MRIKDEHQFRHLVSGIKIQKWDVVFMKPARIPRASFRGGTYQLEAA